MAPILYILVSADPTHLPSHYLRSVGMRFCRLTHDFLAIRKANSMESHPKCQALFSPSAKRFANLPTTQFGVATGARSRGSGPRKTTPLLQLLPPQPPLQNQRQPHRAPCPLPPACEDRYRRRSFCARDAACGAPVRYLPESGVPQSHSP